MPRYILTGGPGAGKTTLLGALASLGYTTVEESARSIIAERLAAGMTSRPQATQFAQEILRRDIEKYEMEGKIKTELRI
jgi:predicted ATPase